MSDRDQFAVSESVERQAMSVFIGIVAVAAAAALALTSAVVYALVTC